MTSDKLQIHLVTTFGPNMCVKPSPLRSIFLVNVIIKVGTILLGYKSELRF